MLLLVSSTLNWWDRCDYHLIGKNDVSKQAIEKISIEPSQKWDLLWIFKLNYFFHLNDDILDFYLIDCWILFWPQKKNVLWKKISTLGPFSAKNALPQRTFVTSHNISVASKFQCHYGYGKIQQNVWSNKTSLVICNETAIYVHEN